MLSAAQVAWMRLGKGCNGGRWGAGQGHMKISKTATQCGSCRWHIVATWSTVHHQYHQHHQYHHHPHTRPLWL